MRRRVVIFLSCGLYLAAVVPSVWLGAPGRLEVRLVRAQFASLFRMIPVSDRHWVNEASQLSARCPRLDAALSVLLGDYRLVGVAGFVRIYPGLPDTTHEYLEWPHRDEESTRMVIGAGDSFHSEYDALYQSTAFQYAARYNSVVWPFFRHFLCKGPNIAFQRTGQRSRRFAGPSAGS